LIKLYSSEKVTKKYFELLGYEKEKIEKYFINLIKLQEKIISLQKIEKLLSNGRLDYEIKIITPNCYFVKDYNNIPIFIQEYLPKHPKGVFICQHGNNVHEVNKSNAINLINGIIFIVPPLILREFRFLFKSKILKNVIKTIMTLIFEFAKILSLNRPILTKRYFKPHESYLDEFTEFDKNDILINNKIYFEALKEKLKLIADFEKNAQKINKNIMILQGTGDSILTPEGALKLYNE